MFITQNHTLLKTSVLKKAFAIAGGGFLLICAIGYITMNIIDQFGTIRSAISSLNGRFDMSIYSNLRNSNEFAMLGKISIAAIALIILSSILNVVWAFKIFTASKMFIFSVMGIFVIAQGLGFGLLFVTWNATDLLSIFGISGGMFAMAAIIGYTSKDLWNFRKILISLSIFSMFLGMMVFILYMTGVYNDKLMMFFWGFSGILTIGWIVFDVWLIKNAESKLGNALNSSEDMEFRLVVWFGFKLLSDFVSLLWIIARFYMYARR